MWFIVFIVIFPIFYIFGIGSWFSFNIFDYLDTQFSLDDKSNLEIGKNTKVDVTVNNPNGTIKVDGKSISNLASAVSSAGGATVAYKVAKYMGGPPIAKLATGAGVMAGVQITTYYMSKVLNNGNSNGKGHNFLFHLSNSCGTDNILNNYPLDLLPGIDGLINVCLLFLSLILNIYLARYIININYKKYISDNHLGKIFIKILDRYIRMWSKTSKFILIISYSMLLWCLGFSKFFIFIIFYYKTDISDIINDYPLDLLKWVNISLYAALFLLCVIYNLYLAKYLVNKNYTKYISNNYVGNYIKIIIHRYVKVLSSTKTSKILFISAYIILYMFVILSKLCLIVIINFYT